MNKIKIMFLLYQKKYKTYPEEIIIDGKIYHINADFRNILRILAVIKDENIPENKKYLKVSEWFFDDGSPANILGDYAFINFINMKDTDTDTDAIHGDANFDIENERQFCYDFDAEEIYAGFLSEYGIDLIDVDFMHWYKFKILLDNLSPESAFKRKIELRFMDLNNLYAGNGKKFAELARAKESVQLPERNINTRETKEFNEFNEIWGKAGG